MGFLDKLKPQPRWKHADPAIRLEAVRQLDDEVDLSAVAEADPDLRVRRAAIDRLSDPELLGTIARNDADEETRDRAADRLVSLASKVSGQPDSAAEGVDLGVALQAVQLLDDPRRLSSVAKGDAAEAVRREALARVTDERVLGSIARHAKHGEIAAAALERVAGEAELAEVALHAEDRDIASGAFERLAPLAHLAQLRTIEVRALHKSVSRRARTMIQEIEAAEAARHAAALDRQRRESMLCDAAEQLADIADVAVARTELARVSEAWQALGVTEPAVLSRFGQAVAAAEAGIARRQRDADEALDRQRARAEAIATRVALCERIETVDGDDALEQLAPLEEEWRSLLPLVGEGLEADQLAGRFAQAVAACHKRHALGAALAETRARLEAVVTEAEALPGQDDAEAASARWNSLNREAHAHSVTLAAASRPATDLQERLKIVQQAFDARAAARAAASEQVRHEVVALLTRLGERARRASEAETITLREGERLMRDITAALETAGQARPADDLNAAVATLRTLQEAIAPRVRELREMDDWRRFANAQRQEQLIGMAEAIVLSLKNDESGSSSDLAATAKALRELHAQWHTVAEAPRQSAQRLWDRFRTATDYMRSRCETYFVQVRQERDAALQKKTAIVTEAEALASSSDWVAAASRLQALQAEWQALGQAGRESERVLAQRLRGACNTFFTRRREDLVDRKKVWSDNLARKEALCEKAEAIAVSTEWDKAAAEMKQLQAEWKTIGPVRKNKSEVVWQRFRAAADQFFERYHNRHEIALSARLAEREAIVIGLECLATLPIDEMPSDFAEQVQALRATWQKSAPVPAPGMRALTDRWQAALTQAVVVRPDAFAGTDLDPAAVVHRMEKLVARVESLVSEHCHTKEARLSPTELLAARLRDALASNAMGGRSHEDQKWRSTAELIKDAQAAWQRLPPVDTSEAQALGQRFRDACRRLTEHVRRHTHTPGQQHAPAAGAPARRQHQPRTEAAIV